MDIRYWIWLTKIEGVGPITQCKLLEYFKTPEDIYRASRAELITSGAVSESRADIITRSKSLGEAELVLRSCSKFGIDVIPRDDSRFPKRLSRADLMPVLVYGKGRIEKYEKGTGIVGARRCTREGMQKCIALASEACAQGKAIISGMALGIDGYAHTAALKSGGYTIAVLGCGLDECYPPAHKMLMKEIEAHGAIISEYPPGYSARHFNFPRRNRIIAALSDELVVINAKPGSGSLITAGYAEEFGIPVKKYFVFDDPNGRSVTGKTPALKTSQTSDPEFQSNPAQLGPDIW